MNKQQQTVLNMAGFIKNQNLKPLEKRGGPAARAQPPPRGKTDRTPGKNHKNI
ncbi:Rop family plasmid primer RNA-binding protein, partial [Salmonella enterica subsp. enterica serovar Anatum]